MSAETSSMLFDASLSSPFFPLEDVFLTGFVAKRRGIEVQNFQQFLTDQWQRMGKNCVKEWVALHSCNTTPMYKLWGMTVNENFNDNLKESKQNIS